MFQRWSACEQRLGVRLARVAEDARDVAALADFTALHDGPTSSANVPTTCRSCVMNSTLICVAAALEPRQQLEDLLLDRHVQRRRRLVGNQQPEDCRQWPSRSSRAAAGHPTARAGNGPSRASRPGCRPRRAVRRRAFAMRPELVLFRGPAWTASVSATWSPTVKTGLSDVIGSWKITETSLPRRRRIAGNDSVVRSRPSKRIAPRTFAREAVRSASAHVPSGIEWLERRPRHRKCNGRRRGLAG